MDGESHEWYRENAEECDEIFAGGLSGHGGFSSSACFCTFETAAGCTENGNCHTGMLCDLLSGRGLALRKEGRETEIFVGFSHREPVFSAASCPFLHEGAGVSGSDHAGTDCFCFVLLQWYGGGNAFPLTAVFIKFVLHISRNM